MPEQEERLDEQLALERLLERLITRKQGQVDFKRRATG
jgi:hypothetical protein